MTYSFVVHFGIIFSPNPCFLWVPDVIGHISLTLRPLALNIGVIVPEKSV